MTNSTPNINSSLPAPSSAGSIPQTKTPSTTDKVIRAVFVTNLFLASFVAGSLVFPPATPFLLGAAIIVTAVAIGYIAFTVLSSNKQPENLDKKNSTATPPEDGVEFEDNEFEIIKEKDEKSLVDELPQGDNLAEEGELVRFTSEGMLEANDDDTFGFTSMPRLNKNEMKQSLAQEMQSQQISRNNRWLGKEMLGETDVRQFIQMSKEKHPELNIEYRYGQEKILGEKNVPLDLTINIVNIQGTKEAYDNPLLAGVVKFCSQASEKKLSFENHCVVFIVDHKRGTLEYFDPRNTKLHSKSFDKGYGKSVEGVKAGLKEETGYQCVQYGDNEQEKAVQSTWDGKTCGVQCCRRVQQYISNRPKEGEIGNENRPSPLSTKSDAFKQEAQEFLNDINAYDPLRT